MSKNVPLSIYRPPNDGEMLQSYDYDFVDSFGNFLVDQDGNFLSSGNVLLTPKPASIWDQLPDFINSIQDENYLPILDQMGFPIDAENVIDGVIIPTSLWAPPNSGEFTAQDMAYLVDSLDNMLVTQTGQPLAIGQVLYTPTPASIYEEDDSR